MTDAIRLLDVRERPLDIAEVYATVQDRRAGGVAVFVGAVRDHDGGKAVTHLDYSAHPSVQTTMRSVAEGIVARYDLIALAAVHRIGRLEIGDTAVVTAAACAHRGQAFEACRSLIDELKLHLPIWKHQIFSDGTEEWVGMP